MLSSPVLPLSDIIGRGTGRLALVLGGGVFNIGVPVSCKANWTINTYLIVTIIYRYNI